MFFSANLAFEQEIVVVAITIAIFMLRQHVCTLLTLHYKLASLKQLGIQLVI